MISLDLDLLLRGLTVMAGTYAIFTLFLAIIAFTALAYTGIMICIVKLYKIVVCKTSLFKARIHKR